MMGSAGDEGKAGNLKPTELTQWCDPFTPQVPPCSAWEEACVMVHRPQCLGSLGCRIFLAVVHNHNPNWSEFLAGG